jgi:DNA-binding NarL/FixJ family response regulator
VIANAYDMAAGGIKRDEVNLSTREKDVLTGLCQGLTREEIAQEFGMSINTVKAMLPIIFDKLGATNSLDAVRIATSLDLMT